MWARTCPKLPMAFPLKAPCVPLNDLYLIITLKSMGMVSSTWNQKISLEDRLKIQKDIERLEDCST